MKPPILSWKSNVLDVFDTTAEFEERYAAADAVHDFKLYDSLGRKLQIRLDPDGSVRLHCDKREPPRPEELTALLQSYLQKGGMSAERVRSLTLAELLAEAYPPSGESDQSSDPNRRRDPRRPHTQNKASEQGDTRVLRALSIAAFVAAIAAYLALHFTLIHCRERPPSPGFGSIADDMRTLGEAAIGGALLGGLSTFAIAMMRLGLLDAGPDRKVAYAFIALVPILVAVGGIVWMAFLVVLG